MKQFVDIRRREREFVVREEVYLKLRHAHLKAFSREQVTKLSPKFYRPYLIVAWFGKAAYKLQLLEDSHIHPVFHVSLLKESVRVPLYPLWLLKLTLS